MAASRRTAAAQAAGVGNVRCPVILWGRVARCRRNLTRRTCRIHVVVFKKVYTYLQMKLGLCALAPVVLSRCCSWLELPLRRFVARRAQVRGVTPWIAGSLRGKFPHDARQRIHSKDGGHLGASLGPRSPSRRAAGTPRARSPALRRLLATAAALAPGRFDSACSGLAVNGAADGAAPAA